MLERMFRLAENQTTARTELLAGLATFLTMAYIIFVQPAVLSGAMFGKPTGMDFGAVMTATCLSAALASAIMGLAALLAMSKKDYAGAYKVVRQMSEARPDDAMFQNELAWAIATMKGVEERNLDLAEKIAMRANTAAKGENAEILDTVARVLFLKGEKEKAIEFQEKAVEQAASARKEQFNKTLASYKEGKLPTD